MNKLTYFLSSSYKPIDGIALYKIERGEGYGDNYYIYDYNNIKAILNKDFELLNRNKIRDMLDSNSLGVLNVNYGGRLGTVEFVNATHGYGPLLYTIVMQEMTQMGKWLASAGDGATSDEALNVWGKFYDSPNIIKEERIDLSDVIYCSCNRISKTNNERSLCYMYKTNGIIINTDNAYRLGKEMVNIICRDHNRNIEEINKIIMGRYE